MMQLVVHLLGSIVFVLISSSSLIDCQNIDTRQPILRQINGLADGSLFGYSLVLHQTTGSPSNMGEAISGARIVVSAPKGTAPGSSVPNTGLVYSCPVNPGPCSPLPGKLFDTTPNVQNENKTDQFLGASMESNEDGFVVCAHRYVRDLRLHGKCFFTEGSRALENFQEYEPCIEREQETRIGTNCQAGISSTTVPAGNSQNVLGLGAPGINFIRNNRIRTLGGVVRRSGGGQTAIENSAEIDEEDEHSYQGYAIASGRFRAPDMQDFAISVPRNQLYFGTVHIVTNNNNLDLVSQPLTGMQMGEYFGFSLLAVDLDGDNLDELLVGAPLFRANVTEADTGRVFLYRNNRGNLEFERTIEGRKRFSRFGHAMANLGDINGDGWDDVAISAPFTETGSSDPGTVYIYHSSRSRLLTDEPQQVIRGSDLSLTAGLSGLRGFGTSLASGVDVDDNSYNDLLIGSFLSQQVFLLRTRPLARAQVTITSSPMIVDINDNTRPECALNGTQYACFNLTACANYGGRGLTNTLRLRFNVSGDTENLERRIIFENGNSEFSREITARIDTQSCATIVAYVRNAMIFDIFNPFVVEMSVDAPLRDIPAGNGNEVPLDFSGLPTLAVTGASQVQVETLKECGGGECIPDLRISVTDTQINPRVYQPSTITAGSTSSVDIILDIENAKEDAFQASLLFVLPTNLLELVNVFNQTRNGEVSLNCRSELLDEQNQRTQYDCSLGNPFVGPGRIQLRVNLSPNPRIVGNENTIPINFTVSSLNPESVNTIVDNSNFFVTQMRFEARASITIDEGVVTPELISYADNSQLNEGVALTNITQLGPPVDVSFLIRNSGPSRIDHVQLDISWPLNSSTIGENFYLYIVSIPSSGSARVDCSASNQYINPLNLEGEFIDEGDEEGGDPTVGMGTGRRKKRTTVKRTLRNKRQESLMPTEQGISENVTLNCSSSEVNCVNIRCDLRGFAGSGSVQVDINARLDERYFSTDNDRYMITPSALISIVDGDFIVSNDGSSQRSASAQISVIPAARVVRTNPQPPASLPWWVIVVPILAAAIIITVVAVLLWLFGFFRRRKHEEIKQRREELQNLNDHGVTPAGASLDDIGDTNTEHVSVGADKGGRDL